MPVEIRVPSLGESITTGILTEWHVDDDAFVRRGQAIYDLETDKITSEGTAEVDGRISLSVQAGEVVEIGQVLAIIDETAQAPESNSDTSGTEPEEGRKSGSDIPNTKEEALPHSSVEEVHPLIPSQPLPDEPAGEKAFSPAVRHHLAQTEIDLSTIAGTGKGGRITKGDLIGEQEKTNASGDTLAVTSSSKPNQDLLSKARTSRRKISPLRRRIAERLVEAQQTAAILSTFNEVDMNSVMALRRKYQVAFTEKHGIKLGFMSFFVKATVHALQEVPSLNAQIDGDCIIENHYYDIGVAVSTERGLMGSRGSRLRPTNVRSN